MCWAVSRAAVVIEVGGDAGGPEGVVADAGLDAGGGPEERSVEILGDAGGGEVGVEAMHMIRKGQARWVSGLDVRRQIQFINKLFEVAA